MRKFLWTYGAFGWLWYVARKRLWCAISGHEEYWWCHFSHGHCVANTCGGQHIRACNRCGHFATYEGQPRVTRNFGAYVYADKEL